MGSNFDSFALVAQLTYVIFNIISFIRRACAILFGKIRPENIFINRGFHHHNSVILDLIIPSPEPSKKQRKQLALKKFKQKQNKLVTNKNRLCISAVP